MVEITITKQNFEKEVIQSDKPVLIDFWASWCGPCRMVAPVIAEIAEEQEGKIKVGKINVDEQEELSSKYGITSIPTIVLFRDGKVEHGIKGYHTKEQIEKLFA